MEKIRMIVQGELEEFRLDVYVATNLGTSSRSFVQKLIKSGKVFVNGKVEKPSYTVCDEDIIDIELPEPVKLDIEPENIPLEIVYEDDDLLVVNKPKGMVVHPAPANYSGTMVNALLYHLGDNLSSINGVKRPGIVHRIDKDTTGLVVVAKNDYAHNFLAEQFKAHSISRRYTMIVLGNPKSDNYTVNKPIGRNPKDRLKMAVAENGKSAITHFEVIKRYVSHSYVSATLETGRTHQIRVHSASLGFHLLGDSLYYGGKFKFKTQGQTLHAGLLGFIHPTKKEYVEFSVEEPQYFLDILKKLEE